MCNISWTSVYDVYYEIVRSLQWVLFSVKQSAYPPCQNCWCDFQRNGLSTKFYENSKICSQFIVGGHTIFTHFTYSPPPVNFLGVIHVFCFCSHTTLFHGQSPCIEWSDGADLGQLNDNFLSPTDHQGLGRIRLLIRLQVLPVHAH
jgi:hypothetical protein